MGLRLVEGIDPPTFLALSGRELKPARVESLIGDGMLMHKPDGKLGCTPDGALVLDAVVADLAA
jgi:hypothetical protein